ncbi:putative transcription factor GRAS family [Medicago truncatula]|uniref:GRAS family transcription factor n=1 Tax=Medicago truncatula TaxID=3880 RepID=G7JUT6_MEDTR|nr:scarecrow-like protein 33 isoform X1 [Medicago truncatula]AES88866.1 GRAS family transcription factor [Medicago truncatula]RHN60984.1 putative transcription factor GRAS family [Medicago truncatula]
MDPNFPPASDFTNGYYHFGEERSILVSEFDPNQYDSYLDADPNQYDSFLEADPNQYDSFLGADPLDFAATTFPIEGCMASATDPSLEDTDFSDTGKFINQILMEENVDQRPFYDPLSLQMTEKSFYDALLHTNKPLSPNQHPLDIHNSDGTTSSNSNSNSSVDDSRESKPLSPDTPVSDHVNHVFQFNSPAVSQPHSTGVSNGLRDLDSSITQMAQNIFSDADSVSLFNKSLEEANKFLPPQPQLFTGFESSNLDIAREEENPFVLKSRKNHKREESFSQEQEEEAWRSSKQSAISAVDEDELSEMFDKVLLNVGHMPLCNEHDCLQNGQVKTEELPPSNGAKTRPKKQGKKNETIDLRNLLLMCSQSVYANDNRNANELLKQIRQHSSPSGDGPQRLAHYFANGLEARIVGDGTRAQTFYSSPSTKRISTAEFLKAYQVHLSTSPFKKFAYFFANKMIMKASANAETLHIIDFGILYGFQWPILIKFLSDREGGPPNLKITGIEFPLPGFRPMEKIEETGRRLADYCKRFHVPFEFNAIPSRYWETIQVEDLKIKSNEVVVVNSLMRFKNLLDESIEVNSPRNAVLHLIRKINPAIFVQSIVNGSYNSPFFATRFREALFHFSALYDMFDTVIPRENKYRMLMERESIGREAMNVVACEGLERVERPETYKQWQVRNTRAGFKQLPLNSELMDKFRTKLQQCYHKDFVFDVDNDWMLQGWKGRILYASTCWVPA